MDVYKLGLGYYKDNVDRNSGLTEFSLISDEIAGIDSDKYVVVLNGLASDDDKYDIEALLKSDKKIIFILSDLSCVRSCKEIIDRSELVLHQSPLALKEVNSRQCYGFVPELFYRMAVHDEFKYRENRVLFGGANTGREDLFAKYQVDKSAIFESYCKYYDSEGVPITDSRIPHTQFLKRYRANKYSLLISRSDYRAIGWVTARYFEALANGNLPIADYSYDKFGFLSQVLVNGYEELASFVKDCSDSRRIYLLSYMREFAFSRRNSFREVILNEVS